MLRYLLFILIFINTATLYGQKTIERVEYEAAIDYFNCEMAKFYIERNQGKYEYEAYLDSLAEFGCNFEHLMVFIKERQPQMVINGYLAESIESMKAEFDIQLTNGALYSKLMLVFEEDVLKEHDSEEDYNKRKDILTEELKEKLRTHEMVVNEVVETKEQNDSSFWEQISGGGIALMIFVIFLIGILAGLIRWAWKYFNTGQKNRIKPVVTKNPEELIPVQKNTVVTPQIEATVPDEDTAEVARMASEERRAKQKEMESEEYVEEVVVPPPVIDKTVFFMPYPSVDGSFYEFARRDLFEFKYSAFKFEIKNKEYGLAVFEVISNKDVITDIFMDYERTIKPVCEIEGNPKKLSQVIKPGIVKIITVKPGSVQKRDQHWRLKQKAIIRFEYV